MPDDARARRRTVASVKSALRALASELATLDHHVGTRAGVRDLDLDCLDLVAQDGPLSPGELARRAGLRPATVTGVLDRLEQGGWIDRERDVADRRAVVVRARPDRVRELFGLYGGMNDRLDAILAAYGPAELEAIADFLQRAATAGRTASGELAESA